MFAKRANVMYNDCKAQFYYNRQYFLLIIRLLSFIFTKT